jgi:hypothetical protein
MSWYSKDRAWNRRNVVHLEVEGRLLEIMIRIKDLKWWRERVRVHVEETRYMLQTHLAKIFTCCIEAEKRDKNLPEELVRGPNVQFSFSMQDRKAKHLILEKRAGYGHFANMNPPKKRLEIVVSPCPGDRPQGFCSGEVMKKYKILNAAAKT